MQTELILIYSVFIVFRKTFNEGVEINRKEKAEVLTLENEDILWNQSIMVNHNPKVILDFILVFIWLFEEENIATLGDVQLHPFEPVGNVP